jgi:CHAD domain-containing protein
MTTAPVPDEDGPASEPSAAVGQALGVQIDDGFATPTAGMVLHRVLAGSARTFLLNDVGNSNDGGTDLAEEAGCETVDALSVRMGTLPLWAQSAASALDGSQRKESETERIHQSRVAMRRIRSNLRTFRLALDPSWGTTLRAELAWYGGRLGESRDLHIMGEIIADTGPGIIATEHIVQLQSVVDARMAAVMSGIATERGGARRFQLTEQMMVLWDGPAFKAKAAKPADEVLPAMLHRAWHDLRGAARVARKDSTLPNLHKLRIRLKDLRYGCETVALVEGGPALKTAKAAERLQSKLGDLHDACFAITWLEDLAATRPDLTQPIGQLVTAQREAAAATRHGWKRELKEVERRWRRWQG